MMKKSNIIALLLCCIITFMIYPVTTYAQAQPRKGSQLIGQTDTNGDGEQEDVYQCRTSNWYYLYIGDAKNGYAEYSMGTWHNSVEYKLIGFADTDGIPGNEVIFQQNEGLYTNVENVGSVDILIFKDRYTNNIARYTIKTGSEKGVCSFLRYEEVNNKAGEELVFEKKNTEYNTPSYKKVIINDAEGRVEEESKTIPVNGISFGNKMVVHDISDIPENWVMVGTIAPLVAPNHTEDDYTIMYVGGAKYGDIVDIVMSHVIGEQYNIPSGWEVIESSRTLMGVFCKIQYKPTHYPSKVICELSSCANGVNNNNQIVGYFENDQGDHACIWNNYVMTELETLGGKTSEAYGINDDGQVVGWAETLNKKAHACIWEFDEITDLGTLGGNTSTAIGINNNGQVVGWAETADNEKHACIWESGKISDLGTLGGRESEARDINDKGQIIGWSYTLDGEKHAFLWENGKMTDLGTSNYKSEANGINNNGLIVGTSAWDDLNHNAVVWENGKENFLGYLVNQGCGRQSYAYGVNNKGQVIGKSYATSGEFNGFIWHDYIMNDLGCLQLGNALAINDNGLIVGKYNGFACIWDNKVDTTPPSINEITPSNNSIIDAKAKITVKASDKDEVDSITLQYSLDGISWNDIECKKTKDAADFVWDTTELTGTVKVKATATDTWGNKSIDSPIYTYKISTVPTRSLGTLGGSKSYAKGINEEGQVVGVAQTNDKKEHAYMWKDGKMTDLGSLGGDISGAYDVNNEGRVVGWAYTKDSEGHAFVWENGIITDLGTLGGSKSVAKGINEKGQIVGWACTKDNKEHAFVWENGKMTDLGTLGGSESEANGINDKGQIVGWACTSDEKKHAFVWEDGIMTDLGALGGSESVANGINDKGQIVGWAYTSDEKEHAFVWENGKMTDLGTLGGNSSIACGINDKGQVVGLSQTSNKKERAFIWECGNMTDLGVYGEFSKTIEKISNNGQIIGSIADEACMLGDKSESILPSINSIEPSDNSIVNAESKIKVTASDNIELKSIKLQYSQDGIKWCDVGCKDTKGSAEFSLDTTEFAGSIKVRAIAIDIWDNESSNSPVYTYKISHSISAKDLGTLGGTNSEARAINDEGQIVGWSETGDGNAHAFLFENSKMSDLGTLGGSWSKANAINNKGQIVGTSETTDKKIHAFIWENGKMTDLGSLGGRSDAYGINEKGQVIGTSYYNDIKIHVFLWENGSMLDFGAYNVNPQAYGINEYEQFISFANNNSYINTFEISGLRWSSSGRGIHYLGGDFSFPYALNDKGQVVGYSETFYGLNHAYFYSNDKSTDLGTLGGNSSKAYGINDNDQVVGVAEKSNGNNHAFLWENGKMTDLGTLGGDFSEARGINNKCQIVGKFNTADGYHACIWGNNIDSIPSTEIEQSVKACDLNNDGVINMMDIMKLATAFSTVLGDERYVSAYDLNKDNSINMADVILMAINFNKIVDGIV